MTEVKVPPSLVVGAILDSYLIGKFINMTVVILVSSLQLNP